MIERSQHLRFTLEAEHAAGIAGERLRQHLQRHVALQLRVARTVDLTHPAGANGRGDLVRTEFCADGDGQSTTSLCLALNFVDSIPSVNLRSMEGAVSAFLTRHFATCLVNRYLGNCPVQF